MAIAQAARCSRVATQSRLFAGGDLPIVKASVEHPPAGSGVAKGLAQTVVDPAGIALCGKDFPGGIMVSMDSNMDRDLKSFRVEVKGGRQEVKEVLPALDTRQGKAR